MLIALAILAVIALAALALLHTQGRAHAAQQVAQWRETAIVIANRFAYYIPDEETGCWVWQKAKDPRGYGRMRRRGGHSGLAHRVIYEGHKGPIPKGLSLDHLCSNTSCVNPDHLQPVTPGENTRRWKERSPEQAAEQWRRAREARHP